MGRLTDDEINHGFEMLRLDSQAIRKRFRDLSVLGELGTDAGQATGLSRYSVGDVDPAPRDKRK